MTTTGKVHNVTKEFEFEWRIEDFFTLPVTDDKSCDSPLFSFAGEFWYLAIYSNGQSKFNTVGWIALYLYRNELGPPINLTYSLGLRTFEGKKDKELQLNHIFNEPVGYGVRKLLERSSLLEKKLELAPSDTLTVVCTIKQFSKTDDDDDGGNVSFECSDCTGAFVPSHEQMCLSKPIRCPTCINEAVFRKCFDHECENVRAIATEKLIDDLGNILGSEKHSDLTVKVKNKEFHLHKCILAGRNLYFNLMFKTDMKEKISGIVTIDDCEPDVFHSFVHFLYTGKMNNLSLENVCDLYKVADKYQEDKLKEECLCFMNNKMSVKSFCDFTVLALKYDEKQLLQNATELFCRKTKEIIQSIKWQTFMREYPTEANELHIKALDYHAK